MKVLFATDENSLESKIAKRFGHAKYYLVLDSDKDEMHSYQNSGHSDDHSELVKFTDEGVTHFIIGNIGPHAFEVLDNENAKIYLARKTTAEEALEQLKNGTLQELSEPTLKQSIEKHHDHHGGGNHRNKKGGNHNH